MQYFRESEGVGFRAYEGLGFLGGGLQKHAQCRLATEGAKFAQARIRYKVIPASMLHQDLHKTNCCDRNTDQNVEEGVDPRILYG